jgi:hypothetical protein
MRSGTGLVASGAKERGTLHAFADQAKHGLGVRLKRLTMKGSRRAVAPSYSKPFMAEGKMTQESASPTKAVRDYAQIIANGLSLRNRRNALRLDIAYNNAGGT